MNTIIESEEFKNYECAWMFTVKGDDVNVIRMKYKRRQRLWHHINKPITDKLKDEYDCNDKYSDNNPNQMLLIKLHCFLNQDKDPHYENTAIVKKIDTPSIMDILKLGNKHTQYAYKCMINKIYVHLFNIKITDKTTPNFLIEKQNEVLNYLNELKTDELRINFLRPILIFIDYYIDNKIKIKEYTKIKKVYYNLIKISSSNHKNISLNNKTINNQFIYSQIKPMSKIEINNWVPFNDILNAFDEHKDKLTDVQKVILALQIYTPGRVEKRNLTILGDKKLKKMNYVDLDNNEIIINNFKTSSIYGTYKQMMNKKLRDIINEYIEKYNIKRGDLLFTPTQTKQYPTLLKTGLKIITNKNIDYNMLRRIYVSHLWEHPRSIEQMTADSMKLGHTIETQIKEYLRRRD